ncbi:MAG: hypothetical protein VX498_11155 [Myxococcota bacterium]|nr:hypothetical protein [Myxococcota bacterium]
MSRVFPLVLLCLSLVVLGCGDPGESLRRHQAALERGDRQEAEAILNEGLERYPDALELLVAAAEFNLRADPPEGYRPEEALRYALRAEGLTLGQAPEVTRLLGKAHRAAGGVSSLPEGAALLDAGLDRVNHSDASRPRSLRPFDPDLLEPTLPNLVEQRQRWKHGPLRPTCPETQRLVDAGRYPLQLGAGAVEIQSEIAVEAFCVQHREASDPTCSTAPLRPCSSEERAVVVAAIAPLLSGAPTAARCCADPVIARVRPTESVP